MIIEVKNIGRTFKSTVKREGLKGSMELLFRPQVREMEALKDISFSIEPGSFTGLIGANGAGKTTLLKILSGLIPPSRGEARVLGYEPFKRNIEFRRQIALVMGQKAQLWWDLPALDAFDLLQAIYEIPPKLYQERLQTLAEILDVKNHLHTQIRRLSLGERMKMELIGAILHWPKIIFLDEPTIGLDVLASHKLREFLKTFNHKEKATIILTSHNMDDIERLCSRVMILRSGEMIYDGSPTGLTQEGACRLKIRFVRVPTLSQVSQNTGIKEDQIEIHAVNPDGNSDSSEQNPNSCAVWIQTKKDKIVPILQKLLTHYEIVDMAVEEPSLESVIQNIYSENSSQ